MTAHFGYSLVELPCAHSLWWSKWDKISLWNKEKLKIIVHCYQGITLITERRDLIGHKFVKGKSIQVKLAAIITLYVDKID